MSRNDEAAGAAAGAEYLTFRLGDEEYAIDILQVREIRAHEPVTRIAQAPAFMRGVINLRGTIVPILDLRVKFGMAERDAAAGVVIILDIGGTFMGAAVDAVSDVVVLAAQQVRPAPAFHAAIDARVIRGIAPLDGRMLIVADIASLLAMPGEAPVERAA
jgi:purine-binding chemotaxis protein CheW